MQYTEMQYMQKGPLFGSGAWDASGEINIMKKLFVAAVLAAAGFAGQQAAATPICDFWSPTGIGLRNGYTHYIDLGPILGYQRWWYFGGLDVYGAYAEEGGHICNLAGTLREPDDPFYFNIDTVGSPPILASVWGGAASHMWTLPPWCHVGACLTSGSVTVVAYHPLALPRVHYRPWFFVMTYR